MKKAWQTTEFWVTLITNGIGVAILCGAVNATEGEELGNALKAIAGGVITIATSLGYLKSRTDIKAAQVSADAHIKATQLNADAHIKAMASK